MQTMQLMHGALLLSIVVLPGDALEDAAYWHSVAQQELEEALQITQNTNVAKNVVIFVGDGMGPNTATAARIYRGQQNSLGAAAESGALCFEAFPHVALLKTYSVDKQVPDSACSATALFSGVKTNYETVGVDANVLLGDCTASLNSSTHVHSIVQWAQSSGKVTGFVTNTRVTHATPSALFAHAPDRRWECEAKMPGSATACKDIARQLIEDEPGQSIRVIMGGGRQCLTSNFTNTPEDPVDTWSCQRADGRDLLAAWAVHKQSLGARFVQVKNTGELRAIDAAATDYVLGIFANGHMKYEHERDTSDLGMPSLAEMTRSAIQILQEQQTNGFLLMVESGLIDQAHHRGTARRALNEVVVLENAVKEAVSLTDSADTLIIVTSDHTHTLSLSGYPVRGADILGIASTSKADGLGYTTLSYSIGTANKFSVYNATHVTRADPELEDVTSYAYEQHAAVPNDEETHGGGDVALFARGPMAHLFHSLHEQNYVAHVAAYASQIGPYAKSQSSARTSASKIHLELLVTLLITFLSLFKQIV